jgi:hypothetical protein
MEWVAGIGHFCVERLIETVLSNIPSQAFQRSLTLDVPKAEIAGITEKSAEFASCVVMIWPKLPWLYLLAAGIATVISFGTLSVVLFQTDSIILAKLPILVIEKDLRSITLIVVCSGLFVCFGVFLLPFFTTIHFSVSDFWVSVSAKASATAGAILAFLRALTMYFLPAIRAIENVRWSCVPALFVVVRSIASQRTENRWPVSHGREGFVARFASYLDGCVSHALIETQLITACQGIS